MKDLKTLSDEELLKEYKNRKLIFGTFSVLVLIMVIASVITIINHKIGVSTYLPLTFLPLIILYWNSLNAAKKEINSRNLK